MRRLIVKPFADWDVRGMLHVSRERFGSVARRSYESLINRAYRLLQSDPQRAGVINGEVYNPGHKAGIFLFHLRHARTRGVSPKQARHVIVFTYDETTLTILRVLHDSMDVTPRVSDDESEA